MIQCPHYVFLWPIAVSTSPNDSNDSLDVHTNRAFWGEVIRTFIIALAIALPLKWYIAQPYLVFGQSMDPTFHQNDYLIVNRVPYYNHNPARGDVIVFKYPNDPSQRFIKRIIGLPGETVEFVDGHPVITAELGNQFEVSEPYIVNSDTLDLPPITLGADEYFVSGDNRPKSSDSRLWGPVPRENIIGKVSLRLFPFSDIGYEPGSLDKYDTAN